MSEAGSFCVIGVATRTTNSDESDPSTARLPDLWERATRHPYVAERLGTSAPVAVLTDYASDQDGAYTQVVGARSDELGEVPEGLVAVVVPSEDRHVVPVNGEMPGALIAAWGSVWQQSADGAIVRGYRTDYELHTADGAEIHLSVDAPRG